MTVIHWYRSWPKRPRNPAARHKAHIVDHLPRISIDNYDYMTAENGLPTDRPGFCLLEWDIALSSDERVRFARTAAKRPHAVLVAPYMIYNRDGNPECVHRYADSGNPIGTGWPVCETFGLGCIYIPHYILARFQSEAGGMGMTDASFSRYVFGILGPTTVDWSFHPQHLNGD